MQDPRLPTVSSCEPSTVVRAAHALLHPVAGGSGDRFLVGEALAWGLPAGSSLFDGLQRRHDLAAASASSRLEGSRRLLGGNEPVPVYFVARGVGWAAAIRGHRYGVLVNTITGLS